MINVFNILKKPRKHSYNSIRKFSPVQCDACESVGELILRITNIVWYNICNKLTITNYFFEHIHQNVYTQALVLWIKN
jgi:hypothetical protein